MTPFSLVVGLEIKRELLEGELNDARGAALPVCTALGGMVVPATVFVLVNHSGSEGALHPCRARWLDPIRSKSSEERAG